MFSAAAAYLIDELIRNGIAIPNLCLVDVGVSGGIHPVWRRWQHNLHAIGIDALENEIVRLRANEDSKTIRYIGARAVAPDGDKADTSPSNYALHRASAYAATAILDGHLATKDYASFLEFHKQLVAGEITPPPTEANYRNIDDLMRDPFYSFYAKRFASGDEPRISEKEDTIDSLLAAVEFSTADVLKIDTDGYDFDVLRGANTLLQSVVAIEIEVQFHGPTGPLANTFNNIDTFLRAHGFTLMKLETVNYGRSALPRPFVYDIPAQTEGGPIQWADALYMRDLADTNYAEKFRFSPTRAQLINLLLIADAYGLEDVAAELVLTKPDLIADCPDAAILDFLSTKTYGTTTTYRQVIDNFFENLAPAPSESSESRRHDIG